MTMFEVRGLGRQKGHTSCSAAENTMSTCFSRSSLRWCSTTRWSSAVDVILKTASKGKIGDDKIFLSKIDEAIRIRNQERGSGSFIEDA